ncbi:MAG TPA: O-antigen ligase family protein [Bacteroidales bacterium]|nr:O-antigen ligase family protein [Bacteroidales bacterium]
MNRKPGIRFYAAAALVCLGWLALFEYSLITENRLFMWGLVASVPFLLLIASLFFDPEFFLFSIIFFVPLSVKVDLPGGFALSLISEILMALICGFLVLQTGEIRKADRRIFRYPLFVILMAGIAWDLVCCVMSSMPLVSVKRTFIQAVYILVFFYLFFLYFDRPRNILRFYLLYALGMILPILNGMAWHSQYHFNSQSSYYMPQPFFIEHTIYGATLAFILPVLYYLTFIPSEYNRGRIKRVGFGLLLLLCFTAEFLSYSRAAWLSLLTIPAALVIFYFRIRPVYLIALLGVLVLVWVLNTGPIMDFISRIESRSNRGNLREQVVSIANIQTDISNVERINRWKCALRMFLARPLRGFGPGTYQFQYGQFQVRSEMTRISTYHGEKGNAHSEYLGKLAETGLPGFLIYLAAIFYTLFTAWKIIFRTKDKELRTFTILIMCCLLPYFVHTIFNGFAEHDKIASLYYGSLAAVAALDIYRFRKGS